MKIKRIFKPTAILLLCGLVTSTLFGCGLLPKEEQMLAPPLLQTPQMSYFQIKAQKGTIETDVNGNGTLVSVVQENYCFQYSGGVLEAIHVNLGDNVKKGEVLATLYTDDLDNRIEQQQLTVNQAQLAVADANATLSDDKATSPNDTKLLRTDNSASLNAQFNLEKQQLALDQLNTQKNRSTITSTINGQVIYIADAGMGSNVLAFQTLVTVADLNQLQVRYIGDKIEYFSIGAVINVNYNKVDYQGKVMTNAVGKTTGSGSNDQSSSSERYVQIKVDNLPKDTQIGDTVAIKLTLEKKDNVIMLPSNYVHTINGIYYVNMLDKNGLRLQRDVEIGIQSPTETEIVKGLAEGESVIQ